MAASSSVPISASSPSSWTTHECARSSFRSSAASTGFPELDLPENARPDPEALRRLIIARIQRQGPLPFSEFLRLCLYHPEHGYYLNNDPTIDYQSSPNVHPVFGSLLARQIAAFWRQLGTPGSFTVFEAAASNGRLCADILRALRQTEPELYSLIRYVQQDPALQRDGGLQRLQQTGVPDDKIEIAAGLPDSPAIEGCILSNELLDALPFERVRMRDGRLWELRTGADGENLVDLEVEPAPAIRAYFDRVGLTPGEGCEAEVNLEAPAWLEKAAKALKCGWILTFDYGYEASELYAPWRKRGTLLTFYRHTSGDDPYVRIGRQDITASVDFTTLRMTGEAAGLTTVFQMPQAEYLVALGIGDGLSRPPSGGQLEEFYQLRRAALELTDLAGLGRISVLLQSKGVAPTT